MMQQLLKVVIVKLLCVGFRIHPNTCWTENSNSALHDFDLSVINFKLMTHQYEIWFELVGKLLNYHFE